MMPSTDPKAQFTVLKPAAALVEGPHTEQLSECVKASTVSGHLINLFVTDPSDAQNNTSKRPLALAA